VGKYKEYVDNFNTGMKWVHRLKTIGSKFAAGKVGDAFETIKEGLSDLVTGGTMYLYLVDELTCEPVRAEGYPIKITTPSEIVPNTFDSCRRRDTENRGREVLNDATVTCTP